MYLSFLWQWRKLPHYTDCWLAYPYSACVNYPIKRRARHVSRYRFATASTHAVTSSQVLVPPQVRLLLQTIKAIAGPLRRLWMCAALLKWVNNLWIEPGRRRGVEVPTSWHVVVSAAVGRRRPRQVRVSGCPILRAAKGGKVGKRPSRQT